MEELFSTPNAVEIDIDDGFMLLCEDGILEVRGSIFDESFSQKIQLPEWLAVVIREAIQERISSGYK